MNGVRLALALTQSADPVGNRRVVEAKAGTRSVADQPLAAAARCYPSLRQRRPVCEVHPGPCCVVASCRRGGRSGKADDRRG